MANGLQTLADPTFGLSGQALAVLGFLARMEPSEVLWDEAKKRYDVTTDTFPFYNCRERGVGLRVRRADGAGANVSLIVVFGEDRKSDSMFLDHWVVTGHMLNPPTIKDMPEEAYDRRQFFDFGRLDKITKAIHLRIAEFITERRKADGADKPQKKAR